MTHFFRGLGILFIALVGFTSCKGPEVGLGETLDLEGPVVSVTSPKNLAFVVKNFTFTGTCSDNVGVTAVDLLEKRTGKTFKADISGNTWSVTISEQSLSADGEYEFDVTASDKAGNSTSRSKVTISVTLDSQTPSAFVYQPGLKAKNYWDSLWPGVDRDFATVENFLNGTVQFKGNMNDNYKPKRVTVDIYDGIGAGTLVKTWTIWADQVAHPLPPGATGNIYSWAYDLDTNALTHGGLAVSLDKTKRYPFYVKITAEDETGNVSTWNPYSPDPLDPTPGYFLVYPNADIPWFKVNAQAGDKIPKGGSLSGEAYDDDGLGKVYVKVQPVGAGAPGALDYSSWTDGATTTTSTKVINLLGTSPRQSSWSVPVPTDAGNYLAYIILEDKAGAKPSQYSTFFFTVPDVNYPEVVIDQVNGMAMEGQEIPADGASPFTISGIATDNASVSKVKIAWIPQGVSQESLFTSTAYWTEGTATDSTPYVTPEGIRIWKINMSGADPKNQTWSRLFTITSDFIYNSVVEYKDRAFVIYVEDDTNNSSYYRLNLKGSKQPPQIAVTTPNEGDFVSSYGAKSFTISGTYSLTSPMKNIVVKAGGTARTVASINTVAKTWTIDSSQFPFTNGGQTVVATITDVYGNTASSTRFLNVDTADATIQSITSSSSDGSYNSSALIPIQVKFTEPVLVKTTPLKLSTNAGVTLAPYYTGTGTDTLTFLYQPAAGTDNTADLEITGFASGSVEDRAGNAAVLTVPTAGAANSLSGAKTLVIDTNKPTAPSLSGITQGTTYNTAKIVTVTPSETVAAPGTLEYSTDGGSTWTLYSAPFTVDVTAGDFKFFLVTARQTDAAGNISPLATTLTIALDKAGPAAPLISGIMPGTFSTAQSFTVTGEAGSTLQYSLNNGTSWVNYTGAVSLNPGAGNKATYDVLARQTDSSGNGPVATSSAITVTVDREPPSITTYLPAHNTVQANGTNAIVLTFSEPVWRESGNIVINRVTNSLPMILSVDQYNEYLNALTVLGDPTKKTDFQNGYQLRSNGLLANGAPDPTAKYVLKYDKGYTDATLLPIFNTLGYNTKTIPVDSTQVTGSGTNTITITPAGGLAVGIEYYVTIANTAFRDSVGNTFAGISNSTTYRFTTYGVSTPVIRVNRITSNGYANPTPSNALTTTFRIDLDTPGATLAYTVDSTTTTTDSASDYAEPTAATAGSSYTLGDSNYAKGFKYLITATATKNSVNSTTAKEKAYRTVMKAAKPWFRGSNNSGGPTTAPGFPLRWEDNAVGYIRQGYLESANNYYFVTWEIRDYVHFKALDGGAMTTQVNPAGYPAGTYEAGPTSYGWGAGANYNVYPGGYRIAAHGSYEAWADRRGSTDTWIYRTLGE